MVALCLSGVNGKGLLKFVVLLTAQSEGKYEKCLKLGKQGIKIVTGATDQQIQNKPELLASLYSSMGNAYLEMDNTDKAMEYHQKDLEIARD